MKHKSIHMNSVYRKVFIFFGAIVLAVAFTACDEDPKKENTPELITGVTLTFTPVGGGTTVTATATDPDGTGVADLEVEDEIDLADDTEYTLTIELVNGLFDDTEEEYNITAEVAEEREEHMFFFAWTNNVFTDPAGDGNIDARGDDATVMNYNDVEADGPLGLSTSWTTVNATVSGTFRVVLKHQPDIKSASSTAAQGDTDMDLTFTINID